MKSNIDTIKPKLYELYPQLEKELIDRLIEDYFKRARKEISSLEKPNIALVWGELILKPFRANGEVKMLETILKNRDNPEINTLSETKLKQKEVKLEKFKKVLEIYNDTMANGKTLRHKNRKDEQ